MSHSILSRLTGATALGAAVTTAVILLMQTLIDSEPSPLRESSPGATLTFVPLIEDTGPVRDPRKPEEPPIPVTPPEIQTVIPHDGFATPWGTEILAPMLDGPTGPTVGALPDGDALPVVKVQPVYPARAQQNGVEGYVLVQFAIDELGRVHDVQVIEAEPRGMFERAALKAVERFRYKPRVVNGEATPVTGVQHLVTFELSS